MRSSTHPVEPEELMAYLDGELPVERAAAIAAHLHECRECQIAAAELKSVSESLTAWDVEAKEPALTPALVAALGEREARAASRTLRDRLKGLRVRRYVPWLGGAFAGGVAALLLAFSLIFSLSKGEHAPAHLALPAETGSPTDAVTSTLQQAPDRDRLPSGAAGTLTYSQRAKLAQRAARADLASNLENKASAPPAPSGGPRSANLPPAPMILRTAQLSVVTQDLDKARAAMDQILQRHSGYVGDLAVSAPTDSARRLTASLRVPAAQMDTAMAELKALGRVESESQNGQDVTAQYVDLEARLSNSRNTEQRLIDLLRQRTGKLSDVLEVETEISRVREEIERMEGERRLLSKQVEYATIAATITEEYKAAARALPVSIGTRFHNAAVDGYESAVNFFIGLGLFLVSDGPMLLVWAGILFFPARYVWRKLRNR